MLRTATPCGKCHQCIWGCGESTQVTVYKQGRYQGKPDSRPWDNDLFKGDKLAWEKAIKARNERQDETSRGTPTTKN